MKSDIAYEVITVICSSSVCAHSVIDIFILAMGRRQMIFNNEELRLKAKGKERLLALG